LPSLNTRTASASESGAVRWFAFFIVFAILVLVMIS
jgi:hypothetical protein